MRLIYKCAEVTLVAAVARSAKEGFLRHRESNYAYFIDPVEIPIYASSDGRNGKGKVVLSYPADYRRWKDPINERAWTFQELLLSSRAIQFTYRGIQMIDRTNKPAPDGLIVGRDPQLPNLPWSGKMLSLATDPENTRQVWLSLRGEYSRRSLSYQGDKLLAIAAIAEELGRTYDSRYLAGLWERDLALDLQWNCPRDPDSQRQLPERKLRSQEYVAPSWSWASVDAAIKDFAHVAEGEGERGGAGFKESLGFEVVSCDVEPIVSGFAYGAVKSGVLVVRGLVCSMIWHPHNNGNFDNLLESDGILLWERSTAEPLDGAYQDIAILDASDPELHDGTVVECLATRLIENVRGRDDIEGLMLLPVDQALYRRVGFFKLTRPQSGAVFALKQVTIV